jgi:hypothetical protein
MIAEPVETIVEVELTRRRFTVAEYLRMAEVGLLGEDSRVELLWGEIVEMGPIHIAHTSTVKRLISLLTKTMGEGIILGVQDPVQLSGDSLPQPDVAVLRPRDDFYSERHPGPYDILVLIEVADTSLRYDRRVKGRLYGEAGIADYWIVNLSERRVEVYREPRPDGYRTVTRFAPGEVLSPLAFPHVALDVDQIVGATS